MPIIKDEEIVCYYINQEVVCRECIENEEEQNVGANDIITRDEIKDDELYFCDRCKQKIN